MNNYILLRENNQPIDALFHIPALFCPECSEWRDFYLDKGKPFCDCCHEQLTATDEDIQRVADRSPRSPILRFKTKTA